jgi:hypothetical protein
LDSKGQTIYFQVVDVENKETCATSGTNFNTSSLIILLKKQERARIRLENVPNTNELGSHRALTGKLGGVGGDVNCTLERM